MRDWSEFIFDNEVPFEEKARAVFKFQFEHNPVYRRFCTALEVTPEKFSTAKDGRLEIANIPLLPIRAFKDTVVATFEDEKPDLIFKSSGTSDMQRSVHRVRNVSIYDQSILNGFRQFYDLDRSVIWGYTPGYNENPHSSLIYMLQKLIDEDNSSLSRFLPLDEPLNKRAIDEVEKQNKQLILFGAAFGLLDLLEIEEVRLPSNSIVIETGGMKTHRRELPRQKLHQRLSRGFGLDSTRIHSEYGMAELLSQAYATGSEWFKTVPWLQLSIRDPDDPSKILPPYSEGLIAAVDLANVYSCSFLLTGDKGMKDDKGRVRVQGRWNPRDLRGCNFLIEED